jgi:hypothetical protein
MIESLDLFGTRVSFGPPAVPPVVFYRRPHRRAVKGEHAPQCAHCVMNAKRWYDERTREQASTIPLWSTERDVTILKAVQLITQVDGSTLYLCAQHAQEHANRGNLHV